MEYVLFILESCWFNVGRFGYVFGLMLVVVGTFADPFYCPSKSFLSAPESATKIADNRGYPRRWNSTFPAPLLLSDILVNRILHQKLSYSEPVCTECHDNIDQFSTAACSPGRADAIDVSSHMFRAVLLLIFQKVSVLSSRVHGNLEKGIKH